MDIRSRFTGLAAVAVVVLSASPVASASDGTVRSCAPLNAWAVASDLPDQVCAVYDPQLASGPVQVELLRAGELIEELDGASDVHPGGVHCNRHTGDCTAFPPYLEAQLESAVFHVRLSLRRTGVSGTVEHEPFGPTHIQFSM